LNEGVGLVSGSWLFTAKHRKKCDVQRKSNLLSIAPFLQFHSSILTNLTILQFSNPSILQIYNLKTLQYSSVQVQQGQKKYKQQQLSRSWYASMLGVLFFFFFFFGFGLILGGGGFFFVICWGN
jgi:hypothetical protein